MIIPLDKIVQRYPISGEGVLHIGAHKGEEREAYARCGFRKVVWIEANPELVILLRKMVELDQGRFEFEEVIEAAIHDVNGAWMELNITNNSQSSSVLPLGLHRNFYPRIKVIERIPIRTRRIDQIFREQPKLIEGLTFANLDIQGVELPALRGFGEFMEQFHWIYTEVNRENVYDGNSLVWDIDRFLAIHQFRRKETVFTKAHWGDALYVKEGPVNTIKRRLYALSIALSQTKWSLLRYIQPTLNIFRKQVGCSWRKCANHFNKTNKSL